MGKTIDLLTICRKAGKLVCGFDSSKKAAICGKAFCLVCASDVSAKTLKEALFISEKCGIPTLSGDFTVADAEFCFSKGFGIFAICDEGFAGAFIKRCEPAAG